MEADYKKEAADCENLFNISEQIQFDEKEFERYQEEKILEQEFTVKMCEFMEILETSDNSQKIKSSLLFFANHIDQLISIGLLNSDDLMKLFVVILKILNENKNIDNEHHLFSIFVIRQLLIEFNLELGPDKFLQIVSLCLNILNNCQCTSETEERLLFHCFELVLELFTRFGKYEQQYHNKEAFLPLFKSIITIMKNPDSYSEQIMIEAFKLCRKLYNTNFEIYKQFLEMNFINICFDYIRLRNEITPSALMCFSDFFKNCNEALKQFPEDSMELFFSLIFEEENDQIINATINCLDQLSIDRSFRSKILEIPNIIYNLLALDVSYSIRSSALNLVHSLFYEEEPQIILQALDGFVGFIPFCQLIDTDDSTIIFQALQVLQLLLMKLKYLTPFPQILVTFLETDDLSNKLDSIREEEDDDRISEVLHLLDEEIEEIENRKDCPI